MAIDWGKAKRELEREVGEFTPSEPRVFRRPPVVERPGLGKPVQSLFTKVPPHPSQWSKKP